MTTKLETEYIRNFDVEDAINPFGARKSSVLSEQTEDNESSEPTIPSTFRRTSPKQKKASLEEYKDLFLAVPKILDRKTVFISNTLRARIVDIVRKLGSEKSSVSGFVQNLVTDHLEQYQEEIDTWKKL